MDDNIWTIGLTLNFYNFYTGTKAEECHILKSETPKLAQCFVVPHHPLKSNTFRHLNKGCKCKNEKNNPFRLNRG